MIHQPLVWQLGFMLAQAIQQAIPMFRQKVKVLDIFDVFRFEIYSSFIFYFVQFSWVACGGVELWFLIEGATESWLDASTTPFEVP